MRDKNVAGKHIFMKPINTKEIGGIRRILSFFSRARRGQSLLETMIALFILVIGFLGVFTLLVQSFLLSRTVSNSTIATYLASEGIEIAKSLVDHDMYQGIEGTGLGWTACFGAIGKDYELDYTTTVCPPPQYASDHFLNYNPTTHHYLYSYNDLVGGSSPTLFKRLIRVTPNGDEITVNSIVTWTTGLNAQSLNLEDHFYNWHP